jgi:hypothetical protein
MTRITFATLIALATLTVGCAGNASIVRKDSVGGRVELRGAYMPSMANARLMMVEHCQGPVDAIERGKSLEFRCRGNGVSETDRQELAVQRADATF